jgi:YidC/Oxa1 family membrane protein insertase
MTVALRVALTPLVIPGLKISKKMQDLAPELSKLKELHKTDKQALLNAQAELYKQHGLNPAAGCLPQIVQMLILIGLYYAFDKVLRYSGTDLVGFLNSFLYSNNQLPTNFNFSTHFFYLDLIKPDVYKFSFLPFAVPGLFAILSALGQFLSSKMLMPTVQKSQQIAKPTPQTDDEMMAATQAQMVYMFPLMSLFLAYQFPSGLVIYWLVFSLASIVQQWLISGPGGLAPWLDRISKRS